MYCTVPFLLMIIMVDHFTTHHLCHIHQPPLLACSDIAYQRGFRVSVIHPQWLCGFLYDSVCQIHCVQELSVNSDESFLVYWFCGWKHWTSNWKKKLRSRFHFRQRTRTEYDLTEKIHREISTWSTWKLFGLTCTSNRFVHIISTNSNKPKQIKNKTAAFASLWENLGLQNHDEHCETQWILWTSTFRGCKLEKSAVNAIFILFTLEAWFLVTGCVNSQKEHVRL